MEAFMEHVLYQINNISPWLVYLCFFFSAVLQITVPPYPGDTILIFGGYLGSIGIAAGNVRILLSYLVGTVISSYALYIIGKRKGEAVLRLSLISKYFSPNNQVRARRYLLKYGVIIFFICKFIPGLNSIIIILGGVFKFSPLWAYFGVGAASLVHNILFFLVGRSIGCNIESIRVFLSTYNLIVWTLVVTVSGTYLGCRRYKRLGCKRNKEIL
jgi:membrane protein DedA with SNARE-associated domain